MSETLTCAPIETRRSATRFTLLSLMMFLQYAVWGLWLLILPKYLGAPVVGGGLGFTQGQVGWIVGAAGAIGAVSAPFIAGQLADRYLNAETALGLLLLLGGFVNFGLAWAHTFVGFLLLSIVYSILYMPTLSLTNSVSFQNLDDPQKQFPPIRMFGTIGWIVGAAVFPYVWLNRDSITNVQRIADALKVSGVLSLLYALYCFALLPKTPPRADAENPFAFVKAFGLLRHRGFLVLALVSLPISMIHYSFFIRFVPFLTDAVQIPTRWVGWVTTIGQYSEMAFLLILGFTLKRIGFRIVLTLGALGYFLRFAIFGVGHPVWFVCAAQAFHGLCYAFFFATAFIYVEKVAPPDVRHSAQTVFGIIILGLGPVAAGLYNQLLAAAGYREFWFVESAVALAVMLTVAITVRNPESYVEPEARD